ncbi:Gfo/Idh/MocA family oxidoreductase [Sagittula salina]|uniref:Gfo/Idh/MocA family oxidoreductase n=1 Tax=Sagittula salina TaxID=2820268 RepID=A0A940S375_9RHOB|nr:Gfo/Idh/MocA family oxidoreductase [Sagittula salina]MBP0484806.1 Gfo/Idh/MocA family oxidoreductase [Sagittula salina]
MTVRIAVIGAGIMGADHARIVAEDLPGATLQVVCDMDEARARAIAGRYDAEAATAPEAVIARTDVDAVIVASPDSTHAPLSLACIRAGKKVMCEKPLSQSSGECREVMQAEAASGTRQIMLGFMRRYDPAYRQMRAALTAGTIGRPLMMHNWHRNGSTPSADFTGAMAITNSAPHEFDILRYMLGCEPVSITATQPMRSDDKVAPVVMVLQTVDGQLVTVEVNNNAAYGYDVKAELVGETGTIATNHVSYTRMDKGATQSLGHDADWRDRYAEAYRQQNKAFVRWVQGGGCPELAASAWDGYAAAVIAECGVKALESGSRQDITLIPRPAFYAGATGKVA